MRVEGYEVLEEIGRGGAGLVFRARARDGTIVALKVLGDLKALPEELRALEAPGKDADRRARFQREDRLHRAVGHLEGFVPWIGAGETESRSPFIVMPFVGGGTLRARLARGPLPIRSVLELGRTLAASIGRAHALGIVHRDLKPENVIFTDDGQPLIADLGLAKHFRVDAVGASQSVALSLSYGFRGTAGYMPPEQIERPRDVGPQADVFALGALLYECLAGVAPFGGATVLEVIARVVGGTKDPLISLRPDAPPWLVDVIERALASDPAARFEDGAALVRAFELEDAQQQQLSRPSPPRRALLPFVLGALAGMASLALATALLLRSGKVVDGPEPLAIEILEPPPGAQIVEGTTFLVRGSVRGGTTDVRVDGVSARLTETAFVATQTAARSSNEIRVDAWNAAGAHAESHRTIVITKRPAAPRWYLELPADERPPLPLPNGLRFGDGPNEYVNEVDKSVLVFVPACVFLMGSEDGDETARPVHEVELSAYFLGKYEVTIEQFARFVRATGFKTTVEVRKDEPTPDIDLLAGLTSTGGTWRNPYHQAKPLEGNYPVTCVSWDDAYAYTRWACLELPTEAQWERAAAWDPKARHARRYSWGDYEPGPGTARVGNLADETARRVTGCKSFFTGYDDGYAYLAPIGRFPAGISPCGAHDMTGNAKEWCRDCSRASYPPAYPGYRVTDPCAGNSSSEFRSYRGASLDDGPGSARCFNRMTLSRTATYPFIGYRAALTLSSATSRSR